MHVRCVVLPDPFPAIGPCWISKTEGPVPYFFFSAIPGFRTTHFSTGNACYGSVWCGWFNHVTIFCVPLICNNFRKLIAVHYFISKFVPETVISKQRSWDVPSVKSIIVATLWYMGFSRKSSKTSMSCANRARNATAVCVLENV